MVSPTQLCLRYHSLWLRHWYILQLHVMRWSPDVQILSNFRYSKAKFSTFNVYANTFLHRQLHLWIRTHKNPCVMSLCDQQGIFWSIWWHLKVDKCLKNMMSWYGDAFCNFGPLWGESTSCHRLSSQWLKMAVLIICSKHPISCQQMNLLFWKFSVPIINKNSILPHAT